MDFYGFGGTVGFKLRALGLYQGEGKLSLSLPFVDACFGRYEYQSTALRTGNTARNVTSHKTTVLKNRLGYGSTFHVP